MKRNIKVSSQTLVTLDGHFRREFLLFNKPTRPLQTNINLIVLQVKKFMTNIFVTIVDK